MSESILNKARELGLELSKSKEFSNVREAETMMMQNPEAQIIISEFQAKQHALQDMQAQGLPLSESLQREFGEFQRRMFDNTHITNFFKAQESFENILDQVNKIISESIGMSQGCGCEGECQTDHDCGCESCS
ncbi:MAG: YlbF family regulator [Desulfotomaculaceae bacterium]|nr:YlbF family regulator [Desulfotomaculaceae bacterium]